MNALKAIWTVKAGILVGQEEPQYSRQWSLLSGDYDGKSTEEQILLFHQTREAAVAYASDLQNPGLVNWVTLEFLWI